MEEMLRVLHAIYLKPQYLKGDFARKFSSEIGALASRSFITTEEAFKEYGGKWRVTAAGFYLLKVHKFL